ncbi:hypothetical protein [Anabaena azotica]|uniref:hypothetical protein n=1 Tax=Anabaena azotica TaxID=197653 RepID=UPI0039A5D8F9
MSKQCKQITVKFTTEEYQLLEQLRLIDAKVNDRLLNKTEFIKYKLGVLKQD